MAMLGALGPVLSTVSTIAGTLISMQGQMAAGKAAQQAANYEAAQMELKAQEEQAAAQQEAEQLRHKKNLALSTLTARGAASGFMANDPTALHISEDIERYGTLQEQTAQYGGASRRSGLEGQAAATRASGQAARQGAQYRAMGTLFSGISTLADRYNPARQMASTGAGSLYYGTGGTRTSGDVGGWQTSVFYG